MALESRQQITTGPLLTIIIPTYNRQALLGKLLHTIEVAWGTAGMKEGELEVLVSDNASTDDTWSMLNRIESQFSISIILNRNVSNLGVIENIMNGFCLANGHWVMICGDDDEMHEQGLKRILETLAARQAALYSFWTDSNPPSQWVSVEQALSLKQLAAGYYYYPGNCGLAVASGSLVKQAVSLLRSKTIKVSPWVIMDVYGCAAALSGMTHPVLLSPEIIARHPHHGISTSLSSYYLFEITQLGLIRSAINVDSCTSAGITTDVIKYWFGGSAFASKLWGVFRVGLLNDLPQDKAETLEAASRALRNLPKKVVPYCYAVRILQQMPLGASKILLLLAYLIRNPLTAFVKFKKAMTARETNLASRRLKLADKHATGIYTSRDFA